MRGVLLAQLIGVMGVTCSPARCQPGDQNVIDIRVRLAGTDDWADEVDAIPGQTVEVGVF